MSDTGSSQVLAGILCFLTFLFLCAGGCGG